MCVPRNHRTEEVREEMRAERELRERARGLQEIDERLNRLREMIRRHPELRAEHEAELEDIMDRHREIRRSLHLGEEEEEGDL